MDMTNEKEEQEEKTNEKEEQEEGMEKTNEKEEQEEGVTEQLMTVKAEVTMIDTDSLGSNFEEEDMEEEGVMVTCGKLTLGPATENPATEDTLAEVETIPAMDEAMDNEIVNETKNTEDSVKPGDEEVDLVQEIAVAAEMPSEENLAESEDAVATQSEPSETTTSLEEVSGERLQESAHQAEETINNNCEALLMERSNASQISEEVIGDKEVMETVTSVGQLDKSESHKNVSDQETALARGDENVEADVQLEKTPINGIGEKGDIEEDASKKDESYSGAVPLVDIVVVERVNGGENALDMFSKMIDLDEESQVVSSDDVTTNSEGEEDAVDPKYVIKSIEKLADEDFEAVFEANFGEDEAAMGLSEADLKALEMMDVRVDIVETSTDSNHTDFKSSVIKFQDAIGNYTKAAVVSDSNEEKKELTLDVAKAQDLQNSGADKEDKGETFEKTEVLEQLAEDIAQDIIAVVKEETRSMKEDVKTVDINTETEEQMRIPNVSNMDEVSTNKREAARHVEKEEILIPSEPVTTLERQLVVEQLCLQEDHYVTTNKDESEEKNSDDVQILRKSEVAELLDFSKPNQAKSEEPDAQAEQINQPKEDQVLQQAKHVEGTNSTDNNSASQSFESSDKETTVKSDSTKEGKEAEIEVRNGQGPSEDDKCGRVDGNLKNEPRKSEVKKESVGECLRRYREEEAKARRAAQMRKNYTLLSDQPEVELEETTCKAALPKEARPKVVDKKSAKREEIQQKLLLTMLLSALVIFLLLASSLFQNELNLEQGDEVAVEEFEEETPTWVGPGVFWDYVEYSALSENRLRQ